MWASIIAWITANPTIIGGLVTLIAKWLGDKMVAALPVKANTLVQGAGAILQTVGSALAGSASAVESAAGAVVSTVAADVTAAEAKKQPLNPLAG